MFSNERMFLQVISSVLIFAFVPLAIKYTNATPLTICLFRILITVITLSVIWRNKIDFKSFSPKASGGFKLWLLGFVFFCHWLTYAYAVKMGGAGVGVIGLSTYGIQLVAAGTIFLGHKISKKDIFLFIFSLIGLYMVIPSWNFHNDITRGLIFALLSASFFAALPIINRKSQEFSLETRIFAQFFGACVFLLFFISQTSWNLLAIDWLVLLFLAIFGTLLAHSLWAKISATLSPSITGLTYYAIAPITLLFSAIFLHEKFSLNQLAGAFLIIGSAVVNILTEYSKKSVMMKVEIKNQAD